jgi:hypothetical protein
MEQELEKLQFGSKRGDTVESRMRGTWIRQTTGDVAAGKGDIPKLAPEVRCSTDRR